jgi:hypothetical protein
MDLGKRLTIAILLVFTLGIGVLTPLKRIAGIQDLELAGVEVKEYFPHLSLKSIWTGEFQTRVDKWISANLGLRAAFVRLDNQLNLSLFREISSKYESRIILGSHKWLYEKAYVDSFNNRHVIPQQDLEDTVRSLKNLQRLLELNGVHFLFLITPSKATLYPEYIRREYVVPCNLRKASNYDRILPLLRKHAVRYLDGRQYFLELKRRSPYPLYPQSGTHWSYYSACLFSLEFISSLENLTKRKMGTFQVNGIRKRKTPFGTDDDLARLANILFEKSLHGEYYHPMTSSLVSGEKVVRPRMLFVGGSYLNTLFYFLDKHQIYSDRDCYHYYRDRRTYPAQIAEAIDKKNLDLKKEMLAKDIVVIEANEQALPFLGFGFVEDALKALAKK